MTKVITENFKVYKEPGNWVWRLMTGNIIYDKLQNKFLYITSSATEHTQYNNVYYFEATEDPVKINLAQGLFYKTRSVGFTTSYFFYPFVINISSKGFDIVNKKVVNKQRYFPVKGYLASEAEVIISKIIT